MAGAGAVSTLDNRKVCCTTRNGIGLDQSPRLGQTSTFTATGGTTALLALFAGFEGDAYTLPTVLEPFVGSVSQLVLLTAALPSAGNTVPRAISVPDVSRLVGSGRPVEAFQLVTNGLLASAAVGCVVH